MSTQVQPSANLQLLESNSHAEPESVSGDQLNVLISAEDYQALKLLVEQIRQYGETEQMGPRSKTIMVFGEKLLEMQTNLEISAHKFAMLLEAQFGGSFCKIYRYLQLAQIVRRHPQLANTSLPTSTIMLLKSVSSDIVDAVIQFTKDSFISCDRVRDFISEAKITTRSKNKRSIAISNAPATKNGLAAPPQSPSINQLESELGLLSRENELLRQIEKLRRENIDLKSKLSLNS